PPRSCALSEAKSPWKAPMGVRAAPRMTMGSDMVMAPGERARSAARGRRPAAWGVNRSGKWVCSAAPAGADLGNGLLAGAVEVGVAAHGHVEVLDQTILQAIDPAVQGDRLAAVPGFLQHGGVGQVDDLFDGVE